MREYLPKMNTCHLSQNYPIRIRAAAGCPNIKTLSISYIAPPSTRGDRGRLRESIRERLLPKQSKVSEKIGGIFPGTKILRVDTDVIEWSLDIDWL
jgi:hypothetical protein